MKKILLSVILFFLFSSISYAGPCLTTIASASTNQLACADDDILNVTSAGSITYNDNCQSSLSSSGSTAVGLI